MKIKKHLKELVEKAVTESFDKTGKLSEKTVERFTKAFKSLPISESIPTLSGYTSSLKRVISQNTLTIESPIAISKVEAQKISQLLEKHYQISQTNTSINPGLLGGLRLKIGDLVLDDSINGKIDQLGEIIHG